MKRSVLILLAFGAFFTATAYHIILKTPATVATNRGRQLPVPERLAIRCSPNYIPGIDESIPLLTGWGNYKWKITTRSDSAQLYFNQGMAMYYAFHIIESRASFDKATRFDASCAMAWWGKALAFGPNINDFGYQRPSEAFSSATRAAQLAAGCSPVEKALINAIGVRYSADTSVAQDRLNERYRDAMVGVHQRFPQSGDVATLYADALMLLHPWDLYNHDYSPKPWTTKIVSTIKEALKLSPAHPGANHYLIHAMEASAHPGHALKSAKFLAAAMPNVSHITHMPSHIYIRTGYYNEGIDLNTKALSGYKNYTAAFAPASEGAFLYSLHNLHMKMACAQMAGSYGQALSAAKELQAEIPNAYLGMPGALGHYIQYLHQSPLFTYIRFGKWEELLKKEGVDTLAYTSVLQHFGRGLAYARTGRIEGAVQELSQLKKKLGETTLKEPFTPFNAAYDGGVIARDILEGVIATEQNNLSVAVTYFQSAVKAEDRLIYNEPRDWVLPARQYLGDVLLKAGRYNEAVVVLQKDLSINPSNGWSLTGIHTAFEKLKRLKEKNTAKQRLKNAWLVKDVEISGTVF